MYGSFAGAPQKMVSGPHRGLVEELPDAVQAGHHEDLVEPRDHTRGAARHHGVGEHCDRQLAALQVQVTIDKARNQIGIGRIDDLCVWVLVPGGQIGTHCEDVHAGDGHIRRVDLLGENVDKLTAPDNDIGRRGLNQAGAIRAGLRN